MSTGGRVELVWGKHTRDGEEHEEWHSPDCACAWHPEPQPHWHRCSAHPAPFVWDLPSIEDVYMDATSSHWIRLALRSALERDPVDAANDAEVLYQLLHRRCTEYVPGDAS